jgi:acetyl esterase/lipase
VTPVPTEQARAFLDSFPKMAPIWEQDIVELRTIAQEMAAKRAGAVEPMASVEDVNAGGVSARLYLPIGGERDVLVWLHGGGWMLGSVETYDEVARGLARAGRCAVLSVEYRLAPEHPYPAGLDDCWAAAVWAAGRFDRVAVGGDSSGGNLAAAVALRARDTNAIDLALQLLVYPVLDSEAVDSPSYEEYERSYDGFAGREDFGEESSQGIRYIWEQYVPDGERRREPYASPRHATTLSGLAPALVITAEHDILRAECEAYAARLEDAGVAARIIDYEGQIHGFFQLPALMDDGQDAIRRAGEAVRDAFDNGKGAHR